MIDNRLLEVIINNSGNFLVTGPPGTGKTHLLVELTKYLSTSNKVKPSRILVFSFNRRWSKSIREKTSLLIDKTMMEIPVETFHSFSTDFINKANTLINLKSLSGKKNIAKNGSAAGLGDIKILNSTQQWKLLKKVMLSLETKNYPRTSRYINGSPYMANSYIQEVFDFILRAQENLFSAKELSGKLNPYTNPVPAEMVGIYSRYMAELKSRHLYNYGMLLGESVNILNKYKYVRDHYRKRYDYILIDELHEINKAQFEIIQLISDSNCIFFGNDDEAIYAFRGSETTSFKKIFLNLEPGRILFLKENFRSSPLINNMCQKFISLNKDRIAKESNPKSGKKEILGGEVAVKGFNSLIDETNFICSKIKFLNSFKKIRHEEIAIIVKGLGYETHLIENALTENNIPFIRRGSRNLLDDHYVKYIISFIRLAWAINKKAENKNPDLDSNFEGEMSSIDIHIENILLSEALNIEPFYIKKIKNRYVLRKNKDHDLWDFLAVNFSKKPKKRDIMENGRGSGSKEIKIPAGKAMQVKESGINAFISAVREFSSQVHQDIFQFLMVLIKDSRVGILGDFDPGSGESLNQGNLWSNLGDFLHNVKNFTENNPDANDLGSFIDFLDNIMENQFMEEAEESTRDLVAPGQVNIFSFHQCKGLEFKAVFIPFINDGYLPSKYSPPQAFDIQLFNYLAGEKKLGLKEMKLKHLEGEIRLFYNGISRAKDFLYITADSSARSSLFFEELVRIQKDESSKYIPKKKEAKGSNARSEELYFQPESNWLTKRKALVSTYRHSKGLKTDPVIYYKQLSFLKRHYHPGLWWDSIKKTGNKNNPHGIFPGPFSYSGIGAYKDCPFKYKIYYYFGAALEENIHLTIGNLYHKVLKIFFKSGEKIFSWERMSQILEEEFEKLEFEFRFLKELLKEEAVKNFNNYYKKYMPESPQNTISEKEFSFGLGSAKIRGRIDQINIQDDDTIELIDFKSGTAAYSEKFMKEELQLKIYRLAVDLSEDLAPFRDRDTRMKYICLGSAKKAINEMAGEYFRKDEVIKTLKELIQNIKNERFEPVPGSYMSCLNCLFKILCPKYYGPKN